MATMVKSFAIQGIEGYPVEIEATLLEGLPMLSLSIIGLGDQAVREAGERIQAAIFAAGYQFPKKKVILSLAPGDIRKRGSHFKKVCISRVNGTNTFVGLVVNLHTGDAEDVVEFTIRKHYLYKQNKDQLLRLSGVVLKYLDDQIKTLKFRIVTEYNETETTPKLEVILCPDIEISNRW